MAVAAASYLVATTQAFAAGTTAVWQGFGLFLIGQLGVTYLANKSFVGERTQPCLAERAWRSAWSKVSQPAKEVLLNAGIFFSAGNLRLVLGGLGSDLDQIAKNLTNLSQNNPLLLSGLVLGTSLAAASILRGLWPLVSGKKDSMPSGLSLYLAGATSGVLGIVSLAQGNYAVGFANLIWAASNSMFGRKQQSQSR